MTEQNSIVYVYLVIPTPFTGLHLDYKQYLNGNYYTQHRKTARKSVTEVSISCISASKYINI